MTISGFSFVRNGFNYDVPFLEAIQSILPICDEFIVAVGDSADGTVQAIEALNNPKIKIVHTIWDMAQNKGGKIFADQSNIALSHCTGDWAFHVQADEVIHEQDLQLIKESLQKFHLDEEVEGFLLPFHHFYGSYHYVRTSRRVHKQEVRIFKNKLPVRAYKDSQGFRKYENFGAYEQGLEKGKKLRVVRINAPIYHYTEVRKPSDKPKHKVLNSFYMELKSNQVDKEATSNRSFMDRLVPFTGTHPKVMQHKVASQDWAFTFDKSMAEWRTKDWLLTPLEDLLGIRIGEFRNFIELKNK
jgi:glycosyltransferase involved in cell wall biosynthesis